MTTKSIVKKGVLTKKGAVMRNWKRRLFELDAGAGVLRYSDLRGNYKVIAISNESVPLTTDPGRDNVRWSMGAALRSRCCD